MSLLIDSLRLGAAPPLRLEAADGAWLGFRHPAPLEFLDWLSGSAPAAGRGGIVLDGHELSVLGPSRRVGAGLHTVTGRLPDIHGAQVLDVVLLSRPRLRGWRAVKAVAGLRAQRDPDEEAEARAFAGRTGLAPWIDHDAVGLPPAVALLTDCTRALMAQPRALALHLSAAVSLQTAEDLRATLRIEQQRLGFAVVEIIGEGPEPR